MAKLQGVEKWSRSYTPNRLHKTVSRFPLYFWRMGLAPLLGRVFIVLTTYGRKSHLPRTVMLEYFRWKGKLYIFSGYQNRADWYKNLSADPHVTVQTTDGIQSMLAHRLTEEQELAEAFELVQNNRMLQGWFNMQGIPLTKADFIAQKDDLFLITFEPTDKPTPPPIETDLKWVWALIGNGLGVFYGMRRRRKRKKAKAGN
jgi:deazaflavin-dependent oxidoreductase (nitroreductase family)